MFYCVRYFCVNQPFSPVAEDETFEVSEFLSKRNTLKMRWPASRYSTTYPIDLLHLRKHTKQYRLCCPVAIFTYIFDIKYSFHYMFPNFLQGYCLFEIVTWTRPLLNTLWIVLVFPNRIVWFGFTLFNANCNNISVISWRSVLLVGETGVPWENNQPVASRWQTSFQSEARL